MSALGLDPFQLLWQLIAFGLLIFLLYKLLYRPVLKMLDERTARIRKGMEDAEDARRMAAQAQDEFDKRLLDARKESQEVLNQATKMSQQTRQEILVQARTEAESLIKRARDEMEAERRQMVTELQTQMADLTVAVATRVLGQTLDETAQRRLVSEFIDKAGELK